jgi:hypothetical protein
VPNIYVTGLSREQAREFSRHAGEFFERELGTSRDAVYVFWRDAALFRNGAEAELPTIIQLSWIRRPREHFTKAVAGLTAVVKDKLGRSGSVQVELQEKWDDGAIDGELCSSWAERKRPHITRT